MRPAGLKRVSANFSFSHQPCNKIQKSLENLMPILLSVQQQEWQAAVLENTPFLQDCWLFPNWFGGTFEYFWLRFALNIVPQSVFTVSRGIWVCRGKFGHTYTTVLVSVPLQTESPLRFYPQKQRCGQKKDCWNKRENINKNIKQSICCRTAVYIFTQACIIMACLVCRSSQKNW